MTKQMAWKYNSFSN